MEFKDSINDLEGRLPGIAKEQVGSYIFTISLLISMYWNAHIPWSGILQVVVVMLELKRCGAVGYCMDQLLRRYQSAWEALQTVQLARPKLIDGLLEEAIAPVWKLFDAIGVSFPLSAIPNAWADRS